MPNIRMLKCASTLDRRIKKERAIGRQYKDHGGDGDSDHTMQRCSGSD
jgi:hypothetical protein